MLHARIHLSLFPYSLLLWQRVAQARAALYHWTFVTPDAAQDVALPVLDVRLAGDFSSTTSLIQELLATVSLPNYVAS